MNHHIHRALRAPALAVLTIVASLLAGGCATAAGDGEPTTPPVLLINAFELNDRQQPGFESAWQQVADYMRRQPGFIDARLHARVGPPDARFAYINVARWRSAGDFQAAIGSDEFKALVRDFDADGDYPGLFRVARVVE